MAWSEKGDKVNRQFEQRLRRLEQRQAHQPRASKKRVLPEWLLEIYHRDTGLPFDTDERAMDSMRRMWESQRGDGECELSNSELRTPALLDGSTRPLSGAP